MSITKRAANITPSLTLAITAKANKMKSEGISIIGFGAGEPDFNTPQYIIDAAKVALDKGYTKYTPSSGLLPLRKAICDKFLKDNNLSYTPNQIIVSNGAKHSLYNAVQALIEEGDEVIIPSPFWLTYPELVSLSGGKCVYINTTEAEEFKISAEKLKKAINPKTKAIIFNSPSNPTGTVYSKDEIFALAKVIEEAGIWVIADEIYEKLVYDGAEHISIASYSEKLKEKTIVVNGVSKTYSMTGWRIGYLAAPIAVATAIDGMQSHATSNPCSIAQHATIAALSGGEDFLKEMNETFNERRKYMVKRVREIKGLSCTNPFGAFYVMVNIGHLFGKSFNGNQIKSSLDFAEASLLEGIAVVPGDAFGDDNYIRLSYAISMDDIKIGLDRLEKFISLLK